MPETVTIAGAGPAGLACAISLARDGRHVTVHERHNNVGSRFHGDFQGLENWSDEQDVLDELRLSGISPTFAHHPVTQGVIYDHRGRDYHVRSARPIYYLVRRGGNEGCLDHELRRQAADLGVEIEFGSHPRQIGGPAVLATGPRLADAIAAGYVFETEMPDGNWLALDNRLAPLGYSYLLIHDGRGTVASCMFQGFKNQAEHLSLTVDFFRERVGLEMRTSRPFGGYANFRLPRTAVRGGHLVVGEQAGFQDALAGFGMRYALRSGLLAAQSIITGRSYTELWRQKLRPLLRTGVVNRFLYNIAGQRWRLPAVKMVAEEDAGVVLGKFYRPSVLSRLLFPVARLRYRAALRDPSCDHVDCQCVWCRCEAGQQL